MHARHTAFAVILACTALAGARGLAGQDPVARPAADSIAERLARRVPELMELAEIPGLSIALVRDGDVVWSAAYGVRNMETGAPVTERTVFQAASLSKPVFAYVVMRLVERGVLELDRPLHELLPNERMAHDDRYRRITARMVLSHSTGLPNWGGDTLDLAFDPGTAFRYSGEGYVWLQRVVEQVTGVGLDELARREVLDPLGMDRSGYVWLESFEDDAAVGHDAGGRPGSLRKYDAPNAAYSLLTTAGDYARFVAAVMEGRGLAPETWTEMLAPVLAAEKPSVPDSIDRHIAWALGWGVEREASRTGAAGAALEPGAARERAAGPGGAGASYWHWGDNGPFKAFVVWYPDDGLGLVWFANSVHGLAIAEDVMEVATGRRHRAQAWAEYDRWDDPAHVAYVHLESGRFEEALAAYRTLAEDAAADGDEEAADEYRQQAGWVEVRVRAMRDPVRVPVERLARLAGDYGPRHVVLEDGVLWYQREGARYRLEPLGGGLFQPVGLEAFRIRFEGDADGRPQRIVGLYFDGSTDETARTPGPPSPRHGGSWTTRTATRRGSSSRLR